MSKFIMDKDGHLTNNPDYIENTEHEILSLKNIIISLRKSNREYNEVLDLYEQALYEIIETEKRLEIFTVSDIAKKALGIDKNGR